MRTGKNKSVPGAIVALALLLASGAAARAELRIVSSPGGEVDSLSATVRNGPSIWRAVIIDGPCLSACTLVLSAVPEDRICITRRAILGFHAARRLDEGGNSTRRLTRRAAWPRPIRQPIRSWIDATAA